MKCPKCNTEYNSDDVFCTGCGLDVRAVGQRCSSCNCVVQQDDVFCPNCGLKVGIEQEQIESAEQQLVTQEPEIELSRDLLVYLSATIKYNNLSPLAAPQFHIEEGLMYKGKSPDKVLINAIASPDRAFYLTSFTKKSGQQILLMKDHQSYHWKDNGDRIVIQKKANPGAFFEQIVKELKTEVSHTTSAVFVLTSAEKKLMRIIYELSEGMEMLSVKTPFIIKSELENQIEDEKLWTKSITNLEKKGLIKLLGSADENQIIVITAPGREIAQVLGNAHYYSHFMTLTAGKDTFPSFNLAGTSSGLYLVETSADGESIMVRTLDLNTLRSMLEWAWLKDVDMMAVGK